MWAFSSVWVHPTLLRAEYRMVKIQRIHFARLPEGKVLKKKKVDLNTVINTLRLIVLCKYEDHE